MPEAVGSGCSGPTARRWASDGQPVGRNGDNRPGGRRRLEPANRRPVVGHGGRGPLRLPGWCRVARPARLGPLGTSGTEAGSRARSSRPRSSRPRRGMSARPSNRWSATGSAPSTCPGSRPPPLASTGRDGGPARADRADERDRRTGQPVDALDIVVDDLDPGFAVESADGTAWRRFKGAGPPLGTVLDRGLPRYTWSTRVEPGRWYREAVPTGLGKIPPNRCPRGRRRGRPMGGVHRVVADQVSVQPQFVGSPRQISGRGLQPVIVGLEVSGVGRVPRSNVDRLLGQFSVVVLEYLMS